MDYQRELTYVGNENQLFSVKEYVFSQGKARGSRGIDIANGAGLSITLVPDRCLDFYQITLLGKNLSFITPSGLSAPAFYNPSDKEFLHSFFAGFLTTCGITYTGSPCVDQGQELGLHGRIPGLPAERLTVEIDRSGKAPEVVVRGVITEAVIFGRKLRLTREVRCPYGENRLTLTDQIENIGYEPSEHMILYHFNLGYPLLSERSRVFVPATETVPRTDHAATGLGKQFTPLAPVDHFDEMVYLHKLRNGKDGRAGYGMYNPDANIGLSIQYSQEHLEYLTQWNVFGKGEYVMGLETTNQNARNRQDARENGLLKWIAPGASVVYRHDIRFYNDQAQFDGFVAQFD